MDYRWRRSMLPPEAFVVAPAREPDPTDLIDKRTWTELTSLPDDVSLRTSNHHGSALSNANAFWARWVSLVLDVQSLVPEAREDALSTSCLLVSDELQASTYLALTGFYRQAIAVLRFGLEATLAGAYLRAFPDPVRFQQWADGHDQGRLWVRDVRRKLAAVDPYASFENDPFPLLSDGGIVAFLYERLSAFSHGRPNLIDDDGRQIPTSNVGLWGGSNGPVYEFDSFRIWSVYYFEVAFVCLLLVGLAEPGLRSHPNPTDMSFGTFVRLTLSWQPIVPPMLARISEYLVDPGTP